MSASKKAIMVVIAPTPAAMKLAGQSAFRQQAAMPEMHSRRARFSLPVLGLFPFRTAKRLVAAVLC